MARLPDFAQGIVALDVGPWFGSQRQSLRRLYRRRFRWLPVDQAVQQVQDMGLRRDAGLQRQVDGGEHGLFVMLEDQGQNLDHLAVAARRLEHALLQSPEGGRQLDKRRAVTQGSRLALNDREIVPPVAATREAGSERLPISTSPSIRLRSRVRIGFSGYIVFLYCFTRSRRFSYRPNFFACSEMNAFVRAPSS